MNIPSHPQTHNSPASSHQAHGFGQVFGLDPRIAVLTFVIDNMLFAGEVGTLGTSIVLSIIVGLVLGVITYRAQMKWYGDDAESALIKGGILALLTAIPTSIPAVVYMPAGLLGLLNNLRRK